MTRACWPLCYKAGFGVGTSTVGGAPYRRGIGGGACLEKKNTFGEVVEDCAAGARGKKDSASQVRAGFGIVAETQGRRPPRGGGVGPPCRPADPGRPCYFWDFFYPKWSKNRFFGAKNGPKMAQK